MTSETPDRTPNDKPEPAADTPATPRRKRRRLKTALVVLAATAVVLIALEIGLRATGFVYYYEKGLEPSDFPEESFVILCVGDSSTGGMGAPAGLSYPAQLERILRERQPELDVHVVNLGAPGMNTSQLVRRFEGYIRLHRPDLILPLIGNNDVWNAAENYITVIGHREEDELDEQLAADLKLWADKLRVVRLMRSALLLVHDGRKDYFNPMESRGPDWGAFHHGMDYLGEVERVTDLYLMNYRRMEKIAAKYGAEILWLDYHVGARLGETAYVEVALKEMGVPSVDLFPLFHDGPQPKGLLRKEEATARRDLLNDDLWHPNATGYALIARAVYNKMVELDYVDGPQIAVFEDLEPYTDSVPSGHAKATPSEEAKPSPREESAGL